MDLTILGKYGPYSNNGKGATSGYLYSEGDLKLLLDIGSGTLTRLLKIYDISEIDGIFISHLHNDHVADFLPLIYLLEMKKITIDVYVQKSDLGIYTVLFNSPNVNVINIDENSKINIKGKNISFYSMNHPIQTLGIKIEGESVFAYTGDTKLCDNVYKLIDKCDVVLADCSNPPNFIGAHMTVKDAEKLLDKFDGFLIATHIPPEYDNQYVFEKEGVIFAKENVTYSI